MSRRMTKRPSATVESASETEITSTPVISVSLGRGMMIRRLGSVVTVTCSVVCSPTRMSAVSTFTSISVCCAPAVNPARRHTTRRSIRTLIIFNFIVRKSQFRLSKRASSAFT